jgi:hypothetical protein
VLQQLLGDLISLLPCAVFGGEYVLPTEALALALRIIEICAAQPMQHSFAQHTAPDFPHLLRP